MEEREKEQKKQKTKAVREEQDAQKPQTVQVAQDVFKGKPVEGEDRVLKVGMQAFGEEMVQYMGQEGKIVRVAPTEQVHLENRKLLEDFNFEMDGGYWRHYEFESDEIRVKDLRRFREYEAFVSMTYEVPVITTVVCSADMKQVRSCIEQGINTYKVEVVQLKQKNADWELQNIWSKMESGDKLTKVDLVAVALLPLMSGDTSIYDRCSQGFQILKKAQENMEKEEIKKLQAMLYTLACKFLTEEDLIKLKEAIDMTVLGQALINDATEKGIIALINAGRHFKASKEETTAIVKDEYSLSQKRAEDYVTQYWGE